MLNQHPLDAVMQDSTRSAMAASGYSEKAIDFYLERPFMGALPDASQISAMTGSCGDTMTVSLKIDHDVIADIRYQVLGCPGAVAAAMAAANLVKGRSLAEALTVNDSDIFSALEEIPAQKHHCIQLAVKTLHQSIADYSAQHP